MLGSMRFLTSFKMDPRSLHFVLAQVSTVFSNQPTVSENDRMRFIIPMNSSFPSGLQDYDDIIGWEES